MLETEESTLVQPMKGGSALTSTISLKIISLHHTDPFYFNDKLIYDLSNIIKAQ